MGSPFKVKSNRSKRLSHGAEVAFQSPHSTFRRNEPSQVGSLRDRHRPSRRRLTSTVAEDAIQEGPNKEASAIILKAATLSEDQLLARYHELVDQRFERPLDYKERFELERIEARLDAACEADMERVAAARGAWETDRTKLISSLEQLLADLRAPR